MKAWTIGAWKVKLDARLACGWGYWGLGFGAGVYSWRSLYPWLTASVWVGPFTVGVDLTRPLPDWKPAATTSRQTERMAR